MWIPALVGGLVNPPLYTPPAAWNWPTLLKLTKPLQGVFKRDRTWIFRKLTFNYSSGRTLEVVGLFLSNGFWCLCAAMWWHNEYVCAMIDASAFYDPACHASPQSARLFTETSNRINRLWMDRSLNTHSLIKTTSSYFRFTHGHTPALQMHFTTNVGREREKESTQPQPFSVYSCGKATLWVVSDKIFTVNLLSRP